MKDQAGKSPTQYFLGVNDDSDDRQLLGLDDGPITVAMIEVALRRRLMTVYRHPQGRSPEADQVKKQLRQAALVLRRHVTTKEQIQQSASPAAQDVAARVREPMKRVKASRASAAKQPQLTEFDRMVLAVLISSGGWNHLSRGRLMALAASYGVPVEALGKIVTGLGQYARSGSGLMAQTVDDSRQPDAFYAGVAPAPYARRKPEPTGYVPRAINATVQAFSPTDTGSVVRFVTLFALVVIFICTLLMQWVIKSDDKQQAALRYASPEPEVAPETDANSESRASQGPPVKWRTRFDRRPTFRGMVAPPLAAEAADKASVLEANLIQLKGQIAQGQTISADVLPEWTTMVDQASIGWTLMDRGSRYRIAHAVTEVLVSAKNKPQLAAELMVRLAPMQGPIGNPLELWSGAWRAGMLGQLAGSDVLPPSIVELAQKQLTKSLYGVPTNLRLGFESAARWWLDSQISDLCEGTEFREDSLDRWAAYLRAHDALVFGAAEGTTHASQRQLSLIQSLRALLATETELGRPGPSQQVLGRLLEELDLAGSLEAKQGVLELFNNDAITSNDLWVLTSLLSTFDLAPWFSQDLVLAPDANGRQRGQALLSIQEAWPDVTIAAAPRWNPLGRAAPVDKVLTEQWLMQADKLIGQPELMRHEDLVRESWAFAWLNQSAAAIAGNRESEAQLGLQQVAEYLEKPLSPAVTPTANSSVLDMGWANDFRKAADDVEERLYLLGLLRSATEPVNVGQEGAELLAKAAYTARPDEVRNEVQVLLISKYMSSNVVAIALLNQLPDAPRNASTSAFIQNYTSHILPALHSDLWASEARFALLTHILMLRRPENAQIDKEAEELAKAYVAQTRVVGPRSTTLRTDNPGEAIQMLRRQWEDLIAGVILPPNAADNRGELTRWDANRRGLARGPIQRLVVDQIRILDLLAFIVELEQPAYRDRIETLLAQTLVRRGADDHVLQQLVEVERATTVLWRMRLGAWQHVIEGSDDG